MTMLSPVELSEAELRTARTLMTVKQRRKLIRREHGLFKHLTSDAAFFAREDKYARQALARYYQTITRVTRTAGADYRVQLPGQREIRAVRSQYEQAKQLGYPCRIVEPAPEPINAADRTMQRTLKIA